MIHILTAIAKGVATMALIAAGAAVLILWLSWIAAALVFPLNLGAALLPIFIGGAFLFAWLHYDPDRRGKGE